jgi:hypothetical protein
MNWLIAAASLALVAACAAQGDQQAHHTWRAGPDAQTTFETAKARCSFVLQDRLTGAGPVSTSLNYTIAGQSTLGDCLKAQGWIEVKMETPAQTAARCESQMAQLRAALGPGTPIPNENNLMSSCRATPAEIDTL